MTHVPIPESDILATIIEASWKDLGISFQDFAPYAPVVTLFFMSQTYKEAASIHFDSPLKERGAIADDMSLQQFNIDIVHRWKEFLIARTYGLQLGSNGPNGERSF